MDVSRRWFIGGAASFGAFGGCRFFRSSSFRAGGSPVLRFGVISDIHVIAENLDDVYEGNTATLEKTLDWFDAQGADAVLIAGDMADAGLVSQLRCVADAWNKYFPGNRSLRDGRRVEKLFIYGNHDWEGQNYSNRIFGRESKNLSPDHIRVNGMKETWEEVFEEDYSPIYMKNVKGYSFIGQHWDSQGWNANCKFELLPPFLDKVRGALDPELPFFYFQHPHPKDTCYGPWIWGHDTGIVTKALSAYPNAIAFSGHSHAPLTDERSIWQGAFTSVGTASLRYVSSLHDEHGGRKTAPAVAPGELGKSVPAGMTYKGLSQISARHGMLWSVYDDCITVARREFLTGLSLGDDWVMPLPVAEPRPFAFSQSARRFRAPEFVEGAELKAVRTKTKGKGDNDKEIAIVKVAVPPAKPDEKARCRSYRFEFRGEDGGKPFIAYGAPEGVSHSLSHKKARVYSFYDFNMGDLPKGKLAISVVPLNCFGAEGAKLEVSI